MLFGAGAVNRKGTGKQGNVVGDGSAEARAREMCVEVSAATFDFMGETFTVLDCPGSLEFLQESLNAAIGVDAAIVVCEPDLDRVVALMPLLRFLDSRAIPYLIFINKMDRATVTAGEILTAIQGVTKRPAVLRQMPIQNGETVSGYIDLIHERAYQYKDGDASDLIEIPAEIGEAEQQARTEMLALLADFDDGPLAKLLEDEVPPTGEMCGHLRKDFQEGKIIPVLLGAAERENGVRRLLKMLRHDLPEPDVAATRAGLDDGGDTVVQVLKTYQTPTSGKLSLVRVWRGTLKEGMSLDGSRVASVSQIGRASCTERV